MCKSEVRKLPCSQCCILNKKKAYSLFSTYNIKTRSNTLLIHALESGEQTKQSVKQSSQVRSTMEKVVEFNQLFFAPFLSIRRSSSQSLLQPTPPRKKQQPKQKITKNPNKSKNKSWIKRFRCWYGTLPQCCHFSLYHVQPMLKTYASKSVDIFL